MSITIRIEDIGAVVMVGLFSYSSYRVYTKISNFIETHFKNTEQIKKLTEDNNTFKNYIDMLNRLNSNGLMGSSSCNTLSYSEIPACMTYQIPGAPPVTPEQAEAIALLKTPPAFMSTRLQTPKPVGIYLVEYEDIEEKGIRQTFFSSLERLKKIKEDEEDEEDEDDEEDEVVEEDKKIMTLNL